MRDLTKLALTGEQPTNQSKASNPLVAFHIVGFFFHHTVMINCVEAKYRAFFFKCVTDITLIFFIFSFLQGICRYYSQLTVDASYLILFTA